MNQPNTQEQLEQIKLDIKDAKKRVEYKNALEALRKNKHWKKLIKDFYLEEYASRLVKLKAEPAMQKELEQQMCANAMNGIGAFNQFLINIQIEGQRAEMDLAEMDRTEAELLEEEASK